MTVTVNPANPTNQPPVASAGSNQTITLPANTATLTGSGTDADGTIASYAWSQTGGTAATITSPGAATTTITGLTTAGTRTFLLTVTDNQGGTGTATVTVTVNAGNQSPVANAGSNQSITLPTNTATLTGSGTDADGSMASYGWSQTGGTAATITSPGSATTTITGLTTVGTRTFLLTVTDNQGATGTSAATVTVTLRMPTNQPPVASAGSNQTITLADEYGDVDWKRDGCGWDGRELCVESDGWDSGDHYECGIGDDDDNGINDDGCTNIFADCYG